MPVWQAGILVTGIYVFNVMSRVFSLYKMVHRPGIEPGPPAWQASIIPLNHPRARVGARGGGALKVLMTLSGCTLMYPDTRVGVRGHLTS